MAELEIPGYQLLEPIGRGGMASVWRGRQLCLDRVVAIKILRSDKARDPDEVLRFLVEAQSAAKLRHPGVVLVYDANIVHGACYIVMEYMAGSSLGVQLREKHRFLEKDALIVADRVAEAMAHAWKKARLVHCDIKPDNLLTDTAGHVKVADLGLARSLSKLGETPERECAMGTPSFMSPEQVRNQPDLDCRADIYSLGATLYYMVTGRALFQEHTPREIADLQLTGTDTDAQSLNPELSRGLCRLIERMLVKDRQGRIADWDALRTEIAKVKKGGGQLGPGTAPGESTMRRTTTMRITRPVAAAATSSHNDLQWLNIVMALVAIAVAVLGLRLYLAPAPSPTPPSGEVPPSAPTAKPHVEVARSATVTNPDTKAAAVHGATSGDEAAPQPPTTDEPVVRTAESQEKPPETTQPEPATALPAADSQSASAAEFNTVLDRLARRLVTEGIAGARTELAALRADSLPGKEKELDALRALLDTAANMDARILASFTAQRGQTVTLNLVDGPKTLTIEEVKGGVIAVSQAVGVAGAGGVLRLKLGVQSLAPRERLARMGTDDEPDVALVKGLMALNAKSPNLARQYFARTNPLLAKHLQAHLHDRAEGVP